MCGSQEGGALSIIAPKGRTHLSADARFGLVRRGFTTLAEHRGGDVDCAFTDALMAACAMVALPSPSLRAVDNQRGEGKVGTLDGMEHVPCDTSMRAILDPVSPESLRPVCTRVWRHLQRGKALEAMLLLEGHEVVALDGTGYFASPTMPCASCLHQVHRNGSITYAHQMLGAAMRHPE